MGLGQHILRAVTTPRFALPLAAALFLGFGWWAVRSLQLARQIDRRAPTAMSVDDAVAASHDGDLFVRLDGAKLDCSKELIGDFGEAFAVNDSQGRIAAMARLSDCSGVRTSASRDLVGLFRDPPSHIYGEASGEGWNVTPGQLAFLDTLADGSQAWRRFSVALAGVLFMLAYAGSIVASERTGLREAWRVRGLGFWFLAVLPWLAYMAHDYVYVRVIPVPLLAALTALIALAMIVAPEHAFVKKATRHWGLADDDA